MTAPQTPKPTKRQNTKTPAARAGQAKNDGLFDHALEDLPADLRWRAWIRRIEVVLFASSAPVSRATLARVVGSDCRIELLIDDLIEDLNDRPYTVVTVAGGWQMRTRPGAPVTLVTTAQFLTLFGLNSLRDLPDPEVLEEAGLVHRE